MPIARYILPTISRKSAQKNIEKDFPNAFALKCNFKDAAEVTALKDKIAELDIDALINNAYTGSFISSYFHKTETQDFATAFAENIIPTIELTKASICLFRKKKAGPYHHYFNIGFNK